MDFQKTYKKLMPNVKPPSKLKTFDELLHFGKLQLEYFSNNSCDYDYNITGLEPQLKNKYLDQMIELNEYMYTTFSTNNYEHCLCVGGILKLNDAIKLSKLLKKEKYWYSIETKGKIYDINIDETKLNERVLIFYDVDVDSDRMIKANTKKDFEQGKGWAFNVSKNRWEFYTPIHIFDDDSYDLMSTYPEAYEYTNHSLFKTKTNPLVAIFIEDPIPSNDTLYKKLIQMFKKINK